MGSQSDWEVMKEAKDQLDELSITNDQLIISAHRTPNRILDYAKKSLENGIKVIIAGAGGAAHYCSHGDLRTYLRNPNNLVVVSDLVKFSRAVCQGMAYLGLCYDVISHKIF